MQPNLAKSEANIGFLRVQVGTFKRMALATAAGSRRSIEVDNCTVADGSIKDALESPVMLWIVEANAESPSWPQDPQRIGGLFANDGILVSLQLSRAAFERFWAAAGVAGGVWRQIQIDFRAEELDHGTAASVLEATLIEFMSGDVDIDFDEKTGRQKAVAPRKDPASQEIRSLLNLLPSAKAVNTSVVVIVVMLSILWVVRLLFGYLS